MEQRLSSFQFWCVEKVRGQKLNIHVFCVFKKNVLTRFNFPFLVNINSQNTVSFTRILHAFFLCVCVSFYLYVNIMGIGCFLFDYFLSLWCSGIYQLFSLVFLFSVWIFSGSFFYCEYIVKMIYLQTIIMIINIHHDHWSSSNTHT